METRLLCFLLLITSTWAAQCPGSFQCEMREVYSPKSVYVHYGIINDRKLYASVLKSKEDVEITKKLARNWPSISELSASLKNKSNFGVSFTQCQFTETTAVSDVVRRIFNHVNITKLKIESSSFGDVLSSGFITEDSPMKKEFLKDFKHLKELSLNDNDLQYIDDDFFEGFDNLTKLFLNNNGMTRLPSKILVPLTNLEILNLSENSFSVLNSTILRKNTKLQIFSMSNNNQFIPLFPDGFFKNLTNLKEINLVNSKIMQLAGDLLEGTTGLKQLDLSKNHLFYIPPDLFRDCKNLTNLTLSSNYLSSDLFTSDKAFKTLNSLEYLDLSHNKITSLNSKILSGLFSLKSLDMSYNDMTAIDPRAFYSLNKLQTVDFSHNFLTLRSDKFMDEFGPISPFHFVQKSVQKINLSHNNITAIFRDWTWAAKLRELDLSYNHITSLQASDLDFFTLADVNLSSNKIKKLTLGEMKIGTNINLSAHVIIDNNPLLCDCKMHNTLLYLADKVRSSHIVTPSITKDINCNRKNTTEDFTCQYIKPLHDEIGDCPRKCSCRVRLEDQTFLVNCSYRGLSKVPTNIKWIPGGNLEIDFTGNVISKILPKDLIGLNQVTVLSLSDNRLSEIPNDMSFNSMRELYLDNNYIENVKSTILEKLEASTVLKNLTLHGNAWKLGCQSSNLITFIKKMQAKFPELQKVSFDGVSVLTINSNELCPAYITWIIWTFITLAGLGIIIGSILLIYGIYQRKIKVWLYSRDWCLQLLTKKELDKDKIFDAFISFSYKDEEFIVTELVPKLEMGPKPLKLYFNYHNWMEGEWVPQQISESISISRRTIVVLSPNYLDSVWNKLEFSMAHNQTLEEGRSRVIIILYGDINISDITDSEFKTRIYSNTYIKWGDPWFWEKLRYALSRTRTSVKKTKSILENYRPAMTTINEKKESIPDSSVNSFTKSVSVEFYV